MNGWIRMIRRVLLVFLREKNFSSPSALCSGIYITILYAQWRQASHKPFIQYGNWNRASVLGYQTGVASSSLQMEKKPNVTPSGSAKTKDDQFFEKVYLSRASLT